MCLCVYLDKPSKLIKPFCLSQNGALEKTQFVFLNSA